MSPPFSTGYTSPVSESVRSSPSTSPRDIFVLESAKNTSNDARVCVDSLNNTLRGAKAALKASREIARPLKTQSRRV